MTDDRPIAVFKVGGSLLDWPPLPDRISAILASRREVVPVLIVGGGRFVDVLRDLDRIHSLGASRSHALALRLLDATAHLLAAILPGSRVATRLDELPDAWRSGVVPILAPRRVLDDDDRDRPGEALPHAWSVTSDAIAARVAVLLQAVELTLFKSASTPPGIGLDEAARLGLVDPRLPSVARPIATVRLACFRD